MIDTSYLQMLNKEFSLLRFHSIFGRVLAMTKVTYTLRMIKHWEKKSFTKFVSIWFSLFCLGIFDLQSILTTLTLALNTWFRSFFIFLYSICRHQIITLCPRKWTNCSSIGYKFLTLSLLIIVICHGDKIIQLHQHLLLILDLYPSFSFNSTWRSQIIRLRQQKYINFIHSGRDSLAFSSLSIGLKNREKIHQFCQYWPQIFEFIYLRVFSSVDIHPYISLFILFSIYKRKCMSLYLSFGVCLFVYFSPFNSLLVFLFV